MTPNTQIGYLLFAANDDNDAGGIRYDHSADKMQIWTNSGASGSGITIDTSGKVGIGTTSPTVALDVNGSIRGTTKIQGGSGTPTRTTGLLYDAGVSTSYYLTSLENDNGVNLELVAGETLWVKGN